jgi:hypothetical protein
MNIQKIRRIVLTGTAVALLVVSGGNVAQAQSRRSRQEQAARQQKSKNDWRNLATIAAGASAFGFIKDDPTLGFVGALGALYSVDRYEKERKSQNKTARARAGMFSNSYFYRNGRRYDRRVVTRNGQKYYRFVRR